MVWKIAGGIGITLLGLSFVGFFGVGDTIIGVLLVIAGIALLAGL